MTIQQRLLTVVGAASGALGVYFLGVTFSYPADDREKHIIALVGGLLAGCGAASGALAVDWPKRRHLLLSPKARRCVFICVAVAAFIGSAASASMIAHPPPLTSERELWLRASGFIGVAAGLSVGL